jgi:hypothetical protein
MEPFLDFDAILAARRRDANEFYAAVQSGMTGEDARATQRQAFAGLLWSKQAYFLDIPIWLAGDLRG